jgi:hypothetical protein
LEAYFKFLLTTEDIVDVTPYRKRFVYVMAFSQVLMDLKRNMQVVEFEPNQIIQMRKLEAAGVTRESIHAFCDAAYAFVEEGTYFSARSLRREGFQSVLYDLGFSDWFYANLLAMDERFSYGIFFKNLILYKGNTDVTIQSFETDRIQASGVIDAYDLITEMTDVYGCQDVERFKLIKKVQETEIYYDPILDRFYEDQEAYYREIDDRKDV